MMVRYKIFISTAYVATLHTSNAHFGIISSSGGGISVASIDTKKAHHLQSLRVRGGGGGIIEENPEYTSDNGDSSDDEDDEYDDETSAEEEEEDKSSKSSSSTNKPSKKKNVKLYNHSKQRKKNISKNKQVKHVYERIRDGLFSLVGYYNNNQRTDEVSEDDDETIDGTKKNITEK